MAHRVQATAALAAVIWAVLGGMHGCASFEPRRGPEAAHGGSAPWRQLESAHFVLRGDLLPPDAVEVLRTLEETRAAMLAALWPGAPDLHERVPVIALASLGEVAVFLGTSYAAVHLRSAPFSPTLLVSRQTADGGIDSKHELAHYLSRRFLPVQPPWFSEGLAQFLATIHRDLNDDTRSVVGEPDLDLLRFLQPRSISDIDVLLGPIPTKRLERERFYATSWLLVHYLFNNRPTKLDAFQNRLAALEPASSAFEREFPDLVERGALNDVLRAYSEGGQYKHRSFPAARWSGRHLQRDLAAAEVRATRALLRALIPDDVVNPVTAKAALIADVRGALDGTPPPIDALAVAFYRHELVGSPSQPELAQRAVSSHPREWMAWLMAADAAPAGSKERAQSLVRVLALNPNQPEALLRVARDLAQANRWPDVLRLSNRILAEGSEHPDLWLMHLMALKETGRCEAAQTWGAALTGYWHAERSAELRALTASPCQPRDSPDDKAP